MKYIRIPGVPLPVSRLILGGSGSRFASGGDVGELMEAALECGIDAVDTARAYGESEKAIGRWLRLSGRREEIVIISKCCHPSMAFLRRVDAAMAQEDLKRSLEALGTDRIDLLLLHRDDVSVPVERIVDWMDRFCSDGLIGAYGGSNWSAPRIQSANAYAAKHGLRGFAVSSPHFSLGRQRHDPWGNGCRTVTGEGRRAEREYYIRTGMPVVAWSSLCSGVFSGKLKSNEWNRLLGMFGINAAWAYGCADNRERLKRCEELSAQRGVSISQIALAWLLGDEMTVLPVIGASSAKRIRENALAADISLTNAERAFLDLREDG